MDRIIEHIDIDAIKNLCQIPHRRCFLSRRGPSTFYEPMIVLTIQLNSFTIPYQVDLGRSQLVPKEYQWLDSNDKAITVDAGQFRHLFNVRTIYLDCVFKQTPFMRKRGLLPNEPRLQ